MSTTVANLPAAGLQQPTEHSVTISLVVRPPTQRAQPHVPVQLGWRVPVRNRIVVLWTWGVEEIDTADVADVAVDQVTMRQIGFRLGAALRADLDRHLVFLGRSDHRLAFLDGAAGRLFDINVLSALSSVDHLNPMPVVRRSYDHRINVFALENITVVAIGLHAWPGRFDRCGKSFLVHVANRCNVDNAGCSIPLHIAQMVATHSADADMSHRQPFVGPGFARRCQHV